MIAQNAALFPRLQNPWLFRLLQLSDSCTPAVANALILHAAVVTIIAD
jgi:hypothetical protein